jgi:toxin ParE1/3/4
MKHQLTEPAEQDIRDILRDTLRMFGPRQTAAYAGIIGPGIALAAEQPDRPGSLARDELAAGIRMLHLEIAAGRRGGAAHCLYYMIDRLSDGSTGVIVLRVLHERMEPRHRVVAALEVPRDDEPTVPSSPGRGG